MTPPPDAGSSQDVLYAEAAASYGAALERLARGYEPDADRRLDLVQEIHVALWRSFASFDGRCSLRTWVYRVAHNVATSQAIRRRGRMPTLVGLDELEVVEELEIMTTWWRDILLASCGQPELIVNTTSRDEIEQVASRETPGTALSAIRAIATAATRIGENVDPRLALEALAVAV